MTNHNSKPTITFQVEKTGGKLKAYGSYGDTAVLICQGTNRRELRASAIDAVQTLQRWGTYPRGLRVVMRGQSK